MELGKIFFGIFILFVVGIIFFIFKKPKRIDKIEAIFICLVGGLIYGGLYGCYDLGYPPLVGIFIIPFVLFFVGTIFFIIREPDCMKRWQAVSICLFGFLAYGMLIGACYNVYEAQEQTQSTLAEHK